MWSSLDKNDSGSITPKIQKMWTQTVVVITPLSYLPPLYAAVLYFLETVFMSSFCVTQDSHLSFSFCLKHTIIPRGSLSLKVLAELPIIVVLMYQVSVILLNFCNIHICSHRKIRQCCSRMRKKEWRLLQNGTFSCL